MQRHVANALLPNLQLLCLMLSPILSAQRAQTMIELVHLALMCNLGLWARTNHLPCRFDDPRAVRVQAVHGQEAVDQRQTQAQKHGLENGIVAIAQGPRVKLLQTLPQEIHGLVLRRILADLLNGIAQHLSHVL